MSDKTPKIVNGKSGRRYVETDSPSHVFTNAKAREIRDRCFLILQDYKPAKAKPQKRMPLPAVERLNELFQCRYGSLYWRDWRRSALMGSRASHIVGDEYRYVYVDGFTHLEHRLIWKMHTGKEPTLDLDHVNDFRHDNRIENLSEPTQQQNVQNRHTAKSNTGLMGVSFCQRNRSSLADIGYCKKVHHLGYFTRLECAIKARQLAVSILFTDHRRAA